VPTVAELRRHPVKSMGGESLPELDLDSRGVVGDRLWALVDESGKLASGKHSHRFRRIDEVFEFSASWTGNGGAPVLHGPVADGLPADDPAAGEQLSAYVGFAVHLVREGATHHQDAGEVVSLVGTASLAALGRLLGDAGPVDWRRFRSNVLVETTTPWEEEAWVGRGLRLGSAELEVTERVERCRMVDIAQQGLPAHGRVLTTLGAHRDVCLAVYADVAQPGTVRVGDEVELLTR
jgi:uncharacterized protein YcbX